MSIKSKKQIAVISDPDPKTFENKYNERYPQLQEEGTVIKEEVKKEDGEFVAIIIYEKKEHVIETVADEFHAEGITHLCRECPYLQDPEDGRKKRCPCKYAELGETHKDHEACEVFYKDLKAGKIRPVKHVR